jgi:hypothetical protein
MSLQIIGWMRACCVAGCLLLTPMIVADADATLAPAQARHVENLLGHHDVRYLGAYGRVPLQCAHELHGA